MLLIYSNLISAGMLIGRSEDHINYDSAITLLVPYKQKDPDVHYISRAHDLDASYFDVGDIWGLADPGDAWAANQNFLDVIIQKGGTVVFTIPKPDILLLEPSSGTMRELDYLLDNGYKWINDTTMEKAL